jgi:hypothetical protein
LEKNPHFLGTISNFVNGVNQFLLSALKILTEKFQRCTVVLVNLWG